MEHDDANQKITGFLEVLSSDICEEVSENGTSSFVMQDVFGDFITIYTTEYRHSYYVIFSTLRGLKKRKVMEDPTSGGSALLNIYANFGYIKEALLPALKDENHDAYKGILKFYDHVMLEIARLNVWDEYENEIRKYKQELSIMKDDLEKTKQELEKKQTKATNTVDSATEKIENQKKDIKKEIESFYVKFQDETSKIKTDFVTILSIFACIIVGFAGSIGFGNNVLSTLNSISIYKAAFMMIICGLVLYNGLFGLLHMIAKLTSKNIAHRCTRHNGYREDLRFHRDTTGILYDCETCFSDECTSLYRIKRRYPYTYFVNKIFLSSLFIVLLAAFLNMTELSHFAQNEVRYAFTQWRGIIYLVIVVFIFILWKISSSMWKK